MIDRGDIVRHKESGNFGRVTGFGPSRKWVRVKTEDGRNRSWLETHLRVVEYASVTRPRRAEIKYRDGRTMTIPFKCGELYKVSDVIEGQSSQIESLVIVGLLDVVITMRPGTDAWATPVTNGTRGGAV